MTTAKIGKIVADLQHLKTELEKATERVAALRIELARKRQELDALLDPSAAPVPVKPVDAQLLEKFRLASDDNVRGVLRAIARDLGHGKRVALHELRSLVKERYKDVSQGTLTGTLSRLIQTENIFRRPEHGVYETT